MAHGGNVGDGAVLSAGGISKSYGGRQVLADLTFELQAGEILGLLGPNGAGKTTAIRILTTILRPSLGHFAVMGIPDSRAAEIRALIGVLPESNGLPRAMTGAEFLVYMARLYGQSADTAERKAGELLHLFGLDDVGDLRIGTYSRGMIQRLAIARSLINDPKVLFLDEPTLGFDPKGQREMLQVVRQAAGESRVAVVLCSHLLEVVEEICHRVLILNRGRIIAEGPVADVRRRVAPSLTWRVQTEAEAMPKAEAILKSLPGVTAGRLADRTDELAIALEPGNGGGDANAILRQLLDGGVPVMAFYRESTRLSDAFLSMIEEASS